MEQYNKEKKFKIFHELWKLFSNMPYFHTTMALSVLFFVISGLQMWTTDYFREVLGLSENAVHVAFGVVGITGPIVGAGISGAVVTKLGGYGNKRVMPVVLCAGIFAVSVSLPITYFDSPYIVGFLLWCLLTIGAFIMPILTGIML